MCCLWYRRFSNSASVSLVSLNVLVWISDWRSALTSHWHLQCSAHFTRPAPKLSCFKLSQDKCNILTKMWQAKSRINWWALLAFSLEIAVRHPPTMRMAWTLRMPDGWYPTVCHREMSLRRNWVALYSISWCQVNNHSGLILREVICLAPLTFKFIVMDKYVNFSGEPEFVGHWDLESLTHAMSTTQRAIALLVFGSTICVGSVSGCY